MPDISMCRNQRCYLRFDCYRYMAKPNEPHQTYFDFKPEADYFCSDQIKIK